MIMRLADHFTGPDWIIWVLIVFLTVISVMLLSGHGSWFIAGYNTASREEKKKYDEPRLCRIVGAGMAVLTVILFVMKVFENILPANFIYVVIGVVLGDVLIVNILACTIGKKHDV